MKTIRCCFKLSIAIILCIVLVFSAMCTFAYCENEKTMNTQFFAATGTMAAHERQASSSLKKTQYTFVCWINPFEPAVFEKAVLCPAIYETSIHTVLSHSYLFAGRHTAPCKKNIEYFMRI